MENWHNSNNHKRQTIKSRILRNGIGHNNHKKYIIRKCQYSTLVGSEQLQVEEVFKPHLVVRLLVVLVLVVLAQQIQVLLRGYHQRATCRSN